MRCPLWRTQSALAVVGGLLLAACASPGGPKTNSGGAPRQSVRTKIGGSFEVVAGGCQDRAQVFSATAPGEIDTTKGGAGGAPAGFEIALNGNGSHGVRNISSTGKTISFDLHAEGGGAMNDIPLVGRKCINPTGANAAADVFAWVLQ